MSAPVEPANPRAAEPRLAAIVLAAGRATRFGGTKVLAVLEGRPLLQHVLDAVAGAGLGDVVVVLGEGSGEVEAGMAWRAERRVLNPDPGAGLASSLRIGLAALGPDVDAALVLLADQPRVRSDVIGRLAGAFPGAGRPIVVPDYEGGGGGNPAILGRTVWPIAAALTGDRGMGGVIAAHPELVARVPVPGENPDVDTVEDLARVAGA